jgi:hypothetical protein
MGLESVGWDLIGVEGNLFSLIAICVGLLGDNSGGWDFYNVGALMSPRIDRLANALLQTDEISGIIH